MRPHPRLGTRRLWIRIVHPGDEEFLARLYTDPRVMEHIGEGAVTKDEALRDARAEVEMAQYRQFTGTWLVESKADNVPLGCLTLAKLSGHDRDDLQLGYQFAPDWWGNGYATEACERLLQYAFADLDLDRVAALVRPANLGSVRVLDKLGFVSVGGRKSGSGHWCKEYRLWRG